MSLVKEKVTSFECLYNAMQKCANGVRWKPGVISYLQHGLSNTEKLRKELEDGAYEIGAQLRFTIYEPKKREVIALRFRDRQVQRSLLDNYLYDEITRHFIYDNVACQKGKGTDFAIRRLKQMLVKAHKRYGQNTYIYTYDIRNFFGSTSHEIAKAAIDKRVRDKWAREMVHQLIDSFKGDTGIGLGSDIAQFIELSVLDGLDHFIKEKLHVRYYIRYMDDFLIIANGKDKARAYRLAIENELKRLKLKLHPRKCKVLPARRGFKWLGYRFRVKESGKIIMTIDKTRIIRERRKLKKLVRKYARGQISKADIDASLNSWAAHARRGNNHHVIKKMTQYYQTLWRDVKCSIISAKTKD
jgi:RNA-directed DNA polymerase